MTPLVVVLATACGKPQVMPSFDRPPAPVQVAAAVARDVPVYLDQIGRAVAKETVWVQAQVGGKITSASFDDGADLKKGDVLFTVDVRPYEARLAVSEASLLSARASLEMAQTAVLRPDASLARARAALVLARADYERVKVLVETKAVSQSDFDDKKMAVEMREAEIGQAQADVRSAEPETRQAAAKVKQAEAEVAMAKLDVEYGTVRAPIDGRAGHRMVDAGNVIAGMGTPLVMLERLDPIYVDFNVPENDLTAVQRNAARGTLRVEARLPDETDASRVGELTFVDNVIQERSGTVKLRATLPNADHRFWPGRFVKVRLVLETLPGAVLVPAGAPQFSGKGTFVYVVKDDDSADMRIVTIGQRQDDLVVVTSGLKAGENVVVVGQLAVTPGGKVRVEQTAPAAVAAPAGSK